MDVRGVPPFPFPPFPVADEVPLTCGRGRLYPPSRAAMAALDWMGLSDRRRRPRRVAVAATAAAAAAAVATVM